MESYYNETYGTMMGRSVLDVTDKDTCDGKSGEFACDAAHAGKTCIDYKADDCYFPSQNGHFAPTGIDYNKPQCSSQVQNILNSSWAALSNQDQTVLKNACNIMCNGQLCNQSCNFQNGSFWYELGCVITNATPFCYSQYRTVTCC